jgi:hypothetical protein
MTDTRVAALLADRGTQSSLVLGNRNFGAMTPTMVYADPSRWMTRPIVDGSAW